MHTRSIRLCRIVTVPATLGTLLRRQASVVSESGIALTLVSSPGPELEEVASASKSKFHAVWMTRAVSPREDLQALRELTRICREGSFDIVHSSTPKAGLLAAIAGRLAGIPLRLHTFTGQPGVEMHGLRRLLARTSDRVIALLDTHLFADSVSQREFLVREGVVKAGKIRVLGAGSISGVDLGRFSHARWGGDAARATRREVGIAADAVVIVFAGRVTRDKGVAELLEAFDRLDSRGKPLALVLVGPFEPERDPLPPVVQARLRGDPRVRVIGFTPRPEQYMGMADIFCLPSYREGFGTVAIEAAALGLPAGVASVVGLVDAVPDGLTGLWCRPKDVESLRAALQRLIDEPGLRASLGKTAAARARELFDARVVDRAVADEYRRLYNAGTS